MAELRPVFGSPDDDEPETVVPPVQRGQTLQEDVHAPDVRALVAARDWAGLVRYWMAHQYVEALDEAIILVNRQASRKGGYWLRLAESPRRGTT